MEKVSCRAFYHSIVFEFYHDLIWFHSFGSIKENMESLSR
jgi:hypothetical protein